MCAFGSREMTSEVFLGDDEPPSADAAPDVNWRRNHAAVTLATFIGFTGFTLVMPFLPLYFQQLGVRTPGGIAIWSGLSLGVTPAVTAAMTPVWGRFASRFGHKLMVQRSLLSFVVIMALTAFAAQPWQVFALRTIQGVFAGYGPLAMMLAAESSPREHMASAIGWVQTAQRVGPALGPVIGGVLAGAFGLRGAFLASAVVYAAAFLLVAVGYREGRRVKMPQAAPVTFRTLRRVRYFTLFAGGIFVLQVVERSFGPILPLYLGAAGVSAARVPFATGVVFTLAAAAAAVGNHASGRLWKCFRVRTLVSAACVLSAFAAAVFCVVPPIAGIHITAVIFGAGLGIATTTIYTDAGHAVDASWRGAIFGYLQMAYLVGLAVSPVVAGFIGWVSVRGVFAADGLWLIALAVLVRMRMSR